MDYNTLVVSRYTRLLTPTVGTHKWRLVYKQMMNDKMVQKPVVMIQNMAFLKIVDKYCTLHLNNVLMATYNYN